MVGRGGGGEDVICDGISMVVNSSLLGCTQLSLQIEHDHKMLCCLYFFSY